MSISVNEVVVVAGNDGNKTSCSLYDINSGNEVHRLNGLRSLQNGMGCFGRDFIIAAMSGQPCIKVWRMSKGEQEIWPIPCVGLPTSLVVSDCGSYCAVAVDSVIYVWHIKSGALCVIFKQHNKDVTVMRFSSDGSRLISGGKDPMVCVWEITEAAYDKKITSIKPKYVWCVSTSEVKDIFIAGLGIHSRVVIASEDSTCTIYELDTGCLITCIYTDFVPTAVTMNMSEEYMYVGSSAGEIYKIDLYDIVDSEVQFKDIDRKKAFIGHSDEITCLSINILGNYLISGSKDNDCRFWDVTSLACVKRIPCHGAVTNAFPIRTPLALSETDTLEEAPVCMFRMTFDNPEFEKYIQPTHNKPVVLFNALGFEKYFDPRIINYTRESLDTVSRGFTTTENMNTINIRMYSYSLGEELSEMYHSNKIDDDGY